MPQSPDVERPPNTTTPSTQQPGDLWTPGYGGAGTNTAVFQQIADAFERKGYAPTIQQVNQWGSNIDASYLSKIISTINGLPQGTWTRPAAPTAPPAATAPPPATTTTTGGTDLRSRLAAIYAQNGLDINNPGLGDLAGIDYFLQRANETNPNDIQYWTDRLQQEITYRKTGQRGSLMDTPGGGQSGMPALPNVPAFSYDPWNETFHGPTWQGGDFVAPTGANEQNDPGYAFRLQQGLDTIGADASAKGILLSGATDKSQQRYAQDYASSEYDKVYNRALQQYGLSYQQFLDQYQQALTDYNTRYGTWQGNYQNALSAYGLNYGVTSDQYNRAMGQYLQRYGEGQTAYQNQQAEQGNYWNRMMQLYGMGYNGDQAITNAGNQYSLNAGNYLTGMGNAYAAGQVGSGNAYANMYGNLANTGMGTFLSLYGGRNTTMPLPGRQTVQNWSYMPSGNYY